MPTDGENALLQAVETIGGTASAVAVLVVGMKLRKDQALDPTSKMLLRSLCLFNLVLSIFFAIGRAGKVNDGVCQLQGLMIQWFSTAMMLWVILQSYVMYQWIVLKRHFKRMERIVRRSIIAIVVASGALAFTLLGTESYGRVYLWCWLDGNNVSARVLGFDVFLLSSWFISAAVLHLVSRSIRERMQASSIHESISVMLGDANFSVEKKLQVYVGAFVFVWFFALLNRTVESALGHPFFPTAFLQALFLSLQGLFNALLYGNVVDIKQLLRLEDLRKAFLGITPLPRSELTESLVQHRPVSVGKDTPLVPQPRIVFTPRQYSIFITSLNMGEAPLDSFYGDVKDWIVEGHDVYAIGLQECIDLSGLRELILNHLGGPTKYNMYTTSIGSGNTHLGYHGFIALTLFVKSTEVSAGHIHPTKSAADAAATGADLIVTTAQNKGAVGIALHIHDTSVGFVTCHLPSDSKGKSKLTKRNASAHAILKEVILAPEDLGFDLHLQHDHVFVFGDLNYRMDTTGAGGGVNSLTGVSVACSIEKQTLNDDPAWLARKYNMLRHHTDVLYPSLDEVKLIKAALSGSRGAWSSVLRADELRSIMDDGDAFWGFEEPMPCFPPSYKRKKGKLDGSCGDYTDFAATIRGYSNTGDVENMLAQRPKSAGVVGFAGSVERVQNFVAHTVRPISSKLSASEIKNLEAQLNKSGSGSDLPGRTRASTISSAHRTNSTDSEGLERPSRLSDESDYTPGEGEAGDDGEGKDGRQPTRRRKAAVVVTGSTDAPISKKETDPSKLRPPSYTDRILLHSLPDRQDRVTVQAYDFCDTVRCSDHRAVSMTVLVEVNSSVSFGAPKTAEFDYSPLVAERQSVQAAVFKEPAFELYEVVIADLHVTLFDMQGVGEEDDDDDDEDDDEDPTYRDSSQDLADGENPMRRPESIKRAAIASARLSSSAGAQGAEGSATPSPPPSPALSPSQSPQRSALRKGGRRAGGGGVRFGSDGDSPGVSIELSPTHSVAPEEPAPLTEIVVPDISCSAPPEAAAPSPAAPSPPPRPALGRAKTRRRSLFSSLFFSAEPEVQPDLETGKTVEEKNVEEERLKEQQLIKELSRENLDWKGKLHKPNEWRKRQLEERRRLKAEQGATLQHQIAGEVRKVHKKTRKSDDKNIHTVTVVFPLPAKDPLLAHRKVYDYAQVFEIGNAAAATASATQREELTVGVDGAEGVRITKDELLRPFSTFRWSTSSQSTLSVYAEATQNPLQANKTTNRGSFAMPGRTQTVLGCAESYRVKGCASIELGAHVLLKLSNKAGYEFGSSVVSLSQLLHQEPRTLYSSAISQIPLTAGGQKRGHVSGKFSIRFIPSTLSAANLRRSQLAAVATAPV